jgi:hypothetical protein
MAGKPAEPMIEPTLVKAAEVKPVIKKRSVRKKTK